MQFKSFHYLKLALIFRIPFAAATCKNFTKTPASSVPACPECYNYTIPITSISCQLSPDSDPSSATNNGSCTIPLLQYNIRALRSINILAPTFQSNISLSSVDASAIYALASESSLSAVDFDSISGTVDSASLTRSQREIEAGTRKQYSFMPFLNAAMGTVQGCANASLDGVTLMVLAPTLIDDNETAVEGSWVVETFGLDNGTGSAVGGEKESVAAREWWEMNWLVAIGMAMLVALLQGEGL